MGDPIELVSIDTITDEMANRFDAVIICGIKYTKGQQSHLYKAWYGDSYTCLGLAEFVKSEIFKKENKKFIQMDDQEER